MKLYDEDPFVDKLKADLFSLSNHHLGVTTFPLFLVAKVRLVRFDFYFLFFSVSFAAYGTKRI